MAQIDTDYAGPRTWAGLTHRPTTFRQLVEAHLASIRARLGQQHDLQVLFDEVSGVLGDWADRPIGAGARQTSFVGNDGSPVEFSFTFSPDGVRTRVLFEPGGAAATRSELERHLALLAARLGDGTRRLEAVADLFLGPAADPSPFLLLHALEAGHATAPPLHKVYLNPAASGRPPLAVVREAMGRLGLGPAWERVEEHLGADRLGSPSYEPALVALDLVDRPVARVKVYLRHSQAGIDDIELVSRLGAGHRGGRYAELLGTLNPAPLAQWVKAPMTCLAFAADGTALTTTLYCPLDPNLPNDAVAGKRVTELLTRLGIGVEAFRSVAAAASGALPAASNRLSWIGFKEIGRPLVTVYVGLGGTAEAEPHRAAPAGADQEARWTGP
ncbi:tryptophan dimethylallyltransferase family protein [Micromonospora olivasterospora]|uniref:DMATS type aromatic prenyltransferase n=1 Tax=Micromonospora olivasterospora TaxID=1880 RepID=A0A562ID93_MICOL|nr:tryptophan dimethylallyltransferase family protein [Micromonospora olivasterospora]TWH68957.1 DMATS type aromatic prenyltransferase [Micromonospora olivasterospora]